MNDIKHILKIIEQHVDKITPSMETLLHVVYSDLIDIINEDQEKLQIELDRIPSDTDLINQSDWWCVVDYYDQCVVLRLGKQRNHCGVDYHIEVNKSYIKNIDDLLEIFG